MSDVNPKDAVDKIVKGVDAAKRTASPLTTSPQCRRPPISPEQERASIRRVFRQLQRAPRAQFPSSGMVLDAPEQAGVYVIRDAEGNVLHVGRTHRAKRGIKKRLGDHLRGRSSFARAWYDGDGERLRQGCTFQFLSVEEPRLRTLLEFYAIALLCPQHLGVGTARFERGADNHA